MTLRDNIDSSNLRWLISPAAKEKWGAKSVVGTGAKFIYENGRVAGYPAEVSNQLPSEKCVLGQWSNLFVALFTGLDVVVDPYTLSRTRQIQITAAIHADIGPRHARAFCVSTDSAAQ